MSTLLRLVRCPALRLFPIWAVLAVAVPSAALAQSQHWVDPVAGSDFNPGTEAQPWQHVSWALSSSNPVYPLAPCSTIYLLSGTYGASASGESFPWQLYEDISLVAVTPGTVTVDAGGTQTIIILDSSKSFTCCTISGLTLTNGEKGIWGQPNGIPVEHSPTVLSCQFTGMSSNGVNITTDSGGTVAPVIDGCTFTNLSDAAISTHGSNGSTVQPTICNNTFSSSQGYATIWYSVPGCTAGGVIDGNLFSVYTQRVIALWGTPTSGLTSVTSNTIDYWGGGDGSYGIWLYQYTGRLECTGNTVVCHTNGGGIYIDTCGPWHPSSRIENNSFTVCADPGYPYTSVRGAWIRSTSDVTMTGNTFDRLAGGNNATWGIYAEWSTGTVLRNNSCSGFHRDGIKIQDSGQCLLENNTCTSNGEDGIVVERSADTELRDNYCEGNTWKGLRLMCRVQATGNTATNNGEQGIDVQSTGTTLNENVCSGNGWAGIIVSNSGVTAIGNESFENGGSGIIDTNCQCSYYARNVLYKNLTHGLHLSATSTTAPPVILNNTMTENSGNGICTALPSSTPAYVFNCIIWGNLGTCDIAGLAPCQYEYSDIGTCGSPGCDNISANPLFCNPANDDYTLMPGSPCVNTGNPASPPDCDGSIADMGALPTPCGSTQSCGIPFCFGDGCGTACPCGNYGGIGEGCANSTGVGARLDGLGTASVSADNLAFDGIQLLPGKSALLFVGNNAVGSGHGTVFGDGLRCAGGSVVRLGVKVPNLSGQASWGPGLAAKGGWSAGDRRRFQIWYRDPPSGACGSGFNLSNGIEVTFLP